MVKPTFDQLRYKCSTNKSNQTENGAKEFENQLLFLANEYSSISIYMVFTFQYEILIRIRISNDISPFNSAADAKNDELPKM